METKKLDQKGRITLGQRYAGKTVLIDDSNPDCIKLIPVVHIPESEAWLYENELALNQVRQGLAQARQRNFAESSPEVETHLEWLDEIDDDPEEWVDY